MNQSSFSCQTIYLASSEGGVVSHTVVQQLGGGGGCGQQEGQARKRLNDT